MPGKTRTENTFVEMKLQHRWEKRYPDLRCAMTEDPEKYRTPHARQNMSRLQRLGYRPIALTEEEQFELMDCDDHVLMGVSLERYAKNQEAQRAKSYVPDETNETIG